jgi:phosphoenolpyruvate---glycerone phosphotransferase subunit DhaL
MPLEPEMLKSLVKVAAEQVIASAPELTALDQAVGDGDHGANMKRGFEAVLGKLDVIAALPPDEALKTIGKTLVMTVGGASGPLYGSFFLAAGDALSNKQLPADLAEVFGSGVNAVSSRGRSKAGEKTMLDVLVPVWETLQSHGISPDLIGRVRATARDAVARTAPMQATKGRASYLGARSIGHVDPGARSSCVLVDAVCDTLEARS